AQAQRTVNTLSQTLLDKHPDLVAAREAVKTAQDKVTAEIAKAADAIRVDFEKAKTTEEGLSTTLDDQKKQALETSGTGVELAVLMRDLDSNRQVYNTMLERAKQADISGEIKTNNIRILDVAEVPRGPISPNTRKDLQYGVIGGFVLAIGLAFLFEYLDNRIKAPEEIRTHLGVPFLGLLPAAPLAPGSKLTPLLNAGVPPRFAEAFRIVRTNVLFSSPDEGARSVLVSSAGPSEGKTCVASNLAIAIAQTGQRVLIIDTDLRRPRVHEVFNVRQEPGLSNLIVGDAKPSDVIKSSSAGVTVLPAGKIPPNPAELLGSKRFRELFARLSEHFDWIVVDSPPVMAVTDASVVAHMVSGVMFVVSSEMTNRHAARSAIDQLTAARARVIGAVLNRVHLERHPYYYAKYYRREYNEYYISKV
ncbi:MAG TPA: polysaccharide biosynthesis tyrosine autokinase, partial [Vicinamibacterales bacterium]